MEKQNSELKSQDHNYSEKSNDSEGDDSSNKSTDIDDDELIDFQIANAGVDALDDNQNPALTEMIGNLDDERLPQEKIIDQLRPVHHDDRSISEIKTETKNLRKIWKHLLTEYKKLFRSVEKEPKEKRRTSYYQKSRLKRKIIDMKTRKEILSQRWRDIKAIQKNRNEERNPQETMIRQQTEANILGRCVTKPNLNPGSSDSQAGSSTGQINHPTPSAPSPFGFERHFSSDGLNFADPATVEEILNSLELPEHGSQNVDSVVGIQQTNNASVQLMEPTDTPTFNPLERGPVIKMNKPTAQPAASGVFMTGAINPFNVALQPDVEPNVSPTVNALLNWSSTVNVLSSHLSTIQKDSAYVAVIRNLAIIEMLLKDPVIDSDARLRVMANLSEANLNLTHLLTGQFASLAFRATEKIAGITSQILANTYETKTGASADGGAITAGNSDGEGGKNNDGDIASDQIDHQEDEEEPNIYIPEARKDDAPLMGVQSGQMTQESP